MSKRDQITLSDAISRMYDINRNVVSIDPEFLAKGAMDIIGFDYLKNPETDADRAHNAAWYGCDQHLRQLARAYCRGKFDIAARAAEMVKEGQEELFFEALQDRYPLPPKKGREPTYVLRDHLPEDARWAAIDRIGGAGNALIRHARAFEAETVALFGPRKTNPEEQAA